MRFIREGSGRMPRFDYLAETWTKLSICFSTGRDTEADELTREHDPNWQRYRNEGYILFRDAENYPPIKPLWGTLNAIDFRQR
ncbi:MAG: hypothetical protein ACJ746_14780 [Bryobacteraceae bacterium]